MDEQKPDLTVIDGEAPQMPQDATNPPDSIGVPALEELAARLHTLAERKGMTAEERLMVLDGYTVDTFAHLAVLHVQLLAQVVSLMRLVSQLVGNPETPDLEPIDEAEQARALVEQVARARLLAEIEYLEGKPGPGGPRLIVPPAG